MNVEDIKTRANSLRAALLGIEKNIRQLKEELLDLKGPMNIECQGEMLANVTIALRHCEDARMRCGKIIQWAEGGVSVYDKGSQ